MSYACSSGFYAGNRAAEFAKRTERGELSERDIEREHARVYAPVRRTDDERAYISWKELWGGTTRVMQFHRSKA